MAGYESIYTGKQIDDALGKVENTDLLENGFLKLESSLDAPTNLDLLLSFGNYSTRFWTNGPDLTAQGTPSIANVSVTSMGGVTIQTFYYVNILYTRTRLADGTFTIWSYIQGKGTFSYGDTPPSNPQDHDLWFDTSSGGLLIKVYLNGKWVDAASEINMSKAIYDPNNIGTDFYKYVDDSIADINFEAEKDILNNHISDTTVHVTAEDKAKWNTASNGNALQAAIEGLKPEITVMVEEIGTEFSTETSDLLDRVTNTSATFNTHVANTAIHPTVEQQAIWSGKAAGDHTHINDGRVKITADDIVSGIIHIDRIDPSALERTIKVNTEEEMLALTIDEVQNGDSVYINFTQELFVVIDDTKLGTLEAFQIYAVGSVEYTWVNIENKPTTIAGYGITDAYDKTEVDTKYAEVVDKIDEVEKIAQDVDTKLMSYDMSLIDIEDVMKAVQDSAAVVNKLI